MKLAVVALVCGVLVSCLGDRHLAEVVERGARLSASSVQEVRTAARVTDQGVRPLVPDRIDIGGMALAGSDVAAVGESSVPEPVLAGRAALAAFGAHATDVVVVVDPSQQRLWVADGSGVVLSVRVSTGRGGLSGRWGSSGTPTGALRVKAVREAALGGVFKHGRPTGRVVSASHAAYGVAFMTTRLFVLEGLERANASTAGRGVYIHGTNLEGSLGRPLSHGCVRVGNQDAVALAKVVHAGAWMYVLDRPFAG